MNDLAVSLNQVLANTVALDCLSSYGKRIYVPKGIIVQGAEAKKKASGSLNATVGIATSSSTPMFLEANKSYFSSALEPKDIYPYAPMGGLLALRQEWRNQIIRKNPDLKDKLFSTPIVTSGLTNAISLVSSLFIDKDDTLVLPEMYWENYNLIFSERLEANLVKFPNFTKAGRFNVPALKRTLGKVKTKKILLILNFPNNPTGYAPTTSEANAISKALVQAADNGHDIVVICDDAYFGLFFERSVFKQSLFSLLCDAHDRILAVKADGATKEELVWGFRTAFITYGSKGLNKEQLEALEQKTLGSIRAEISSCSLPSQSIILKTLLDPKHDKQKKQTFNEMKARYVKLKEELAKYKDDTSLVPLPFNSGYFMSFETACNAESLRLHLLDSYGTGVICLDDNHIRIAFSSVDESFIPTLLSNLYKGAKEV